MTSDFRMFIFIPAGGDSHSTKSTEPHHLQRIIMKSYASQTEDLCPLTALGIIFMKILDRVSDRRFQDLLKMSQTCEPSSHSGYLAIPLIPLFERRNTTKSFV